MSRDTTPVSCGVGMAYNERMKKQPSPKQSSQPNITIRRQKRQSMMMRAVPGGVEVYIPHWMRPNSRQVQNFIKQGLAKIEAHIPEEPPQITTQAEVLALVDEWAGRMNLFPNRVTMRSMTRKWGSCSSKGNITLNTRLYWLERDLVAYVVVHELAHLQEMSHDNTFWAIVRRYLPDYKTRIEAIDAFSRDLWGTSGVD
jgi:predicted metal-dependent hydrolase